MEAGSETGGRASQVSEFREHLSGEFVEVVGPAVGKRAFGLVPDPFVRVELGGVAGEVFDMKPRMPMQKATELIPFVNLAVVPEQNDLAAQMSEKVAQESADFRTTDVYPMEVKVEGDPMALGTDRQGGNQRHLAMLIAVSGDRGLSPGRPRAANGSDQQEARFVKEDKVGAQVQSPLFMRGHSSRFHRSMRSSSRSRARRSGFWQLHFTRWRSRPT